MYTTLISAKELADLITPAGSNAVVVLDCRFNLMDTDAGARLYNESHIPGAHYVHLDTDLSSAIVAGQSGRHPLPTQDHFIQRLQDWGVHKDTQVIIYDDAGGAIAARAWWMCLWVGHQACAVLNGGFNAWTRQDLPLSVLKPTVQKGTVGLQPSLAKTVDATQVLDANRLLLDARAPERYSGEVEPLDKVAGHIPDALNFPFSGNLDESGHFLSENRLKTRFASVAGTDVNPTHYCGSGVTAAHNILAMMHAGLGMTTLYPGSWSEWVQDSGRPVETSE